jgi:hypothetical protein
MGAAMHWLFTFASGILSSVASSLGMLGIALLCIRWYRISNFEGESGYFVVAMMLLGGIGGFLVGLIAGRFGYAQFGSQWYTQFATSLGTTAGLLLAVLLVAYLGNPDKRGHAND